LPPTHGAHALVRDSRPCAAGERWEWDGVRFELLHPVAGHEALGLKANDRSCVLRLSAGGIDVLIAGDIEARSERQLLARRQELRAEILIAPHHGSITSSTPEFVRAVRPSVVVFSAGYRNRFHHPRPEVIERYRRIDARIVRSDRHGAAEFEIAPDAFTLALERERRRRYWQDPPGAEQDGEAPGARKFLFEAKPARMRLERSRGESGQAPVERSQDESAPGISRAAPPPHDESSP
jgi:competence protein ComEC